ncbi:hypothetical protein VOLN27_74 [Halorubrum virus VOLN27B]|nr:hypothetical protein VOLN27_74 [Halorubrum virus VOLN27B]
MTLPLDGRGYGNPRLATDTYWQWGRSESHALRVRFPPVASPPS